MKAQDVESVGTALLQAELARQGFEVAKPIFDRGIDLIVFSSESPHEFRALPIQVKAASAESFVVNKKYQKFGDLILAYVWGVESQPRFFLLTYDEAVSLLGSAKETRSWRDAGAYSWTRRVDNRRKRAMEEYESRWEWLRARLAASHPDSPERS
jgi:hypothetical protein